MTHRILMYTIDNLQRDARHLLDKKLQHHGLTRYEWMTLALLEVNNGSIVQSELKAYLGIDDSYLSKMLDKLEFKGFVTREVNLNDRRSRLIHSAPTSKKLSAEISHTALEFSESLLKLLSPDERAQLFNLLEKVHAGVK
ncbi:MAG: MarR family transcriptional regulator [Gammaproteobacteria bacterium]|nr:MarR family transcriptional regulator [Gammaproteobacteria bacterium]